MSGHWQVAVGGGLRMSELPEREGNIEERTEWGSISKTLGSLGLLDEEGREGPEEASSTMEELEVVGEGMRMGLRVLFSV